MAGDMDFNWGIRGWGGKMRYSEEYGGWISEQEYNSIYSKEDYIHQECERMDFEEMLQRQGMSEWGDGTSLPPDEGIETVIEPG